MLILKIEKYVHCLSVTYRQAMSALKWLPSCATLWSSINKEGGWDGKICWDVAALDLYLRKLSTFASVLFDLAGILSHDLSHRDMLFSWLKFVSKRVMSVCCVLQAGAHGPWPSHQHEGDWKAMSIQRYLQGTIAPLYLIIHLKWTPLYLGHSVITQVMQWPLSSVTTVIEQYLPCSNSSVGVKTKLVSFHWYPFIDRTPAMSGQ